MKFRIIAAGRIKEEWMRRGIEEYVLRLTPFTKVEFTELQEERMPAHPSEEEKRNVLEAEGARLISRIKDRSAVALLDVSGRMMTSEEFSAWIDETLLRRASEISFVIGGPFGVGENLRKRADIRLSFSAMTFTHQMARLLLLEQLYRAVKISRHEPYHL